MQNLVGLSLFLGCTRKKVCAVHMLYFYNYYTIIVIIVIVIISIIKLNALLSFNLPFSMTCSIGLF